jgi:hypothetical protein
MRRILVSVHAAMCSAWPCRTHLSPPLLLLVPQLVPALLLLPLNAPPLIDFTQMVVTG